MMRSSIYLVVALLFAGACSDSEADEGTRDASTDAGDDGGSGGASAGGSGGRGGSGGVVGTGGAGAGGTGGTGGSAGVAGTRVEPGDDAGAEPERDGGDAGNSGSGGSGGAGGQGGGSPNACGDGNCFGSESCTNCEDDCGACEGDCYEPHTTPGCNEPLLQQCVCSQLFLCCTAQWHEDCVSCLESEGCCGS